MARMTFLSALVLTVLLTSCARLEVYPASEVGLKDKEGIPYYLPMPVLIVGVDLSCRIEYIPDMTKGYIIQTTNAGTFERQLTLTQGWQFVGLTESGTDTTGGIIGTLGSAVSGISTLLTMGSLGIEGPEAPDINLKPGVYYFDFSSGNPRLVPIVFP